MNDSGDIRQDGSIWGVRFSTDQSTTRLETTLIPERKPQINAQDENEPNLFQSTRQDLTLANSTAILKSRVKGGIYQTKIPNQNLPYFGASEKTSEKVRLHFTEPENIRPSKVGRLESDHRDNQPRSHRLKAKLKQRETVNCQSKNKNMSNQAIKIQDCWEKLLQAQ